uniref:AMP-dependent synthetase/ligase domain-containing protein n=1 Tax=Mucochytrium quahogii TaxID=96639 RepID=A0A7S2RUN7_9STRA|mmetsp:Transcript_13172/g.21382  ORF Transcript_13172/g.21382 Transcript_13172/m.21382 type:complete len:234 (-) Transcript_13172:70-771(-)
MSVREPEAEPQYNCFETFSQAVENAAHKFGDRPFITMSDGSGTCTYREYQQGVDRLAAGMKVKFDVCPGDVVVCINYNDFRTPFLVGAVAKLGGIVSFIHYTLTVEQRQQMIKNITPRFLYTTDEILELDGFREALTDSKLTIIKPEELPCAYDGDCTIDEHHDPERVFVMFPTSGSTGTPKSVMCKQAAFTVGANVYPNSLKVYVVHVSTIPNHKRPMFEKSSNSLTFFFSL